MGRISPPCEISRYQVEYPIIESRPIVQGEGVHTGTPMYLIRLYGCNLQCAFCDTKGSWFSHEPVPGLSHRSVFDLIQDVIASGLKIILLTGGEPGIHDLRPLIQCAHANGLKVHVESNGTIPEMAACGADWISLSPKWEQPSDPAVLLVADEIKFLVGDSLDLEQAERFNLANEHYYKKGITRCLQPISALPQGTQLAYETAIRWGWRLSLQTHKLLGVP